MTHCWGKWKRRVKGGDIVENRRDPSIFAGWGNTGDRGGENEDMKI